MKGLNIKKVVALGIGAALVGSALAPVVSAATYNNLDSLERGDVVNAAGQPVVDVVVGSNAAVSDVVWAGNIAAKVAQLATAPASGDAAGEVSDATVDYTTGGTMTTVGAGEMAEIDMPGMVQLSVTNTKMPSLINNNSFKYKYNSSTEQSTTLTETLMGDMTVTAQMQTGSNRYAVGEMVGSVERGDLNYQVALGTTLDLTVFNGLTGLDSNSQNSINLPMFGKNYVLDEVKTNGELVFYAETNPVTVNRGESLNVSSADGSKEYTLKLVDITKVSPAATDYTAAIQILDGETVVDSKTNISSGENLKDRFNVSLADVYITDLTVSDIQDNTGYATIRTGEDRVVMKNNAGFPFTDDPAVDNIAPWRAYFSPSSFDGFVIKNYWEYNKSIGDETNTTKNVLRVGEAIEFPNDFGKIDLIGFQNKPSTELTLGNGKLAFADLKGTPIEVPFYQQFSFADQEVSEVTVGGQLYTLWVEHTTADYNIMYAKGRHAITSRPTAGATWTQLPNQNFNIVTTGSANTYTLDDANLVQLDIGMMPYSGTTPTKVKYAVAADRASGIGYLLLAGEQEFDIYNRGGALGTKIEFLGTQVDANTTDTNPGQIQPYFLPNMSDVLTTALGGNYVVDLNSTTTTKTVQANDYNYYSAQFVFTDATSVASNTTNLAVRADSAGNVWNWNDLQDKTSVVRFGPSLDANNADWGTKAIRDGSDYIMAAATRYGTTVASDNSVFSLVIPEERRKVEAYLGSSDATQVPVGGAPYTGVAVNETEGNVTINAVNGTCTAEGAGVNVVPVGSIVKTDNQGYGKAIIVGGYLANAAAENLEIQAGNKLQDMLLASGDYVTAVLASGDIVAAGFNADDTGTAASALINALEELI